MPGEGKFIRIDKYRSGQEELIYQLIKKVSSVRLI